MVTHLARSAEVGERNGERQMERLLKKILEKKVSVGVIGLGYVGLPLAVEIAGAGLKVVGYDVDASKVSSLMEGRSYVGDISHSQLRPLIEENCIIATTNPGDLKGVDAISICVPTPLNKTKDPDLSYVMAAAEEVAKVLRPGMLVVLESTTWPGTTKDLILPLFERSGLKVGKDFNLCFSPERVDPGNTRYTIRNTPKLIGGITESCTAVGRALYSIFIDQMVPVSTTQVAEMAKIYENTFRAVNIALVNELAIMCRKLDVDTWEAIRAASTKPFGFMPFYPGPGLGGHCIPVDPHYLRWAMESLNYNARFIELASEVNASMPGYVVDWVGDVLNDHGKPFNGSKILVLGVAYKGDIGDVRESPALDILMLLKEKKAKVLYHDPFVPSLNLPSGSMTSTDLDDELLASVDCLLIVTNHSSFDYDHLVSRVPIVIDTRNATRAVTRNRDRIHLL